MLKIPLEETFSLGAGADRVAVIKFLQAHPGLVIPLIEGQSLAERIFGVGQGYHLEVATDPENEELRQQLVAYIHTSLSVTNALYRLERFDEEWIFGQTPKTLRDLMFTLEFTEDDSMKIKIAAEELRLGKVAPRTQLEVKKVEVNINSYNLKRTNTKREREIRDIISLAQETYRVRRPNVCAELKAFLNGAAHVGIGFSKVNWPDKWDEDTGKWIAARKAAKQILHQIEEAKK